MPRSVDSTGATIGEFAEDAHVAAMPCRLLDQMKEDPAQRDLSVEIVDLHGASIEREFGEGLARGFGDGSVAGDHRLDRVITRDFERRRVVDVAAVASQQNVIAPQSLQPM